jgi:hypothetical protein
MPVAMMVDSPDGSQEIYSQVRKQVGLDRPAGGVLHIAGPSSNVGWRVIEVFDSEDAARRFVTEHLAPAFQAIGAPSPPPPEFWPVHSYMTGDPPAPASAMEQ